MTDRANTQQTLSAITKLTRNPGTVLIRFGVLGLLWLVLTEGDLKYWGVALLVVSAATLTSMILIPVVENSLSPVGVLRFIPFFAIQSIRGGFDVTLRAISPTPRVDPIIIHYDLSLADEAARVMLANTMSLMPGSLSVALHEHQLTLHVLHRTMSAQEQIQQLEVHIGRIFRLPVDITKIRTEPG